jgi:hypothetical protein
MINSLDEGMVKSPVFIEEYFTLTCPLLRAGLESGLSRFKRSLDKPQLF